MRRVNPIYLLIALNVLLILFRDVILSEESSAAIASGVESTLMRLGFLGYFGIVLAYVACAFVFVPLLIPLNILGGALYGPLIGTVVAVAGVTAGTLASTISARHVFTGMQSSVEQRPGLRRLLRGAEKHSILTIVLIRFVVVLPYLVQNLALAATKISATRITLVTMLSAIPGAAIYSLLGAGLVRADRVGELLLYIGLPVALLLVLSGAVAYYQNRERG